MSEGFRIYLARGAGRVICAVRTQRWKSKGLSETWAGWESPLESQEVRRWRANKAAAYCKTRAPADKQSTLGTWLTAAAAFSVEIAACSWGKSATISVRGRNLLMRGLLQSDVIVLAQMLHFTKTYPSAFAEPYLVLPNFTKLYHGSFELQTKCQAEPDVRLCQTVLCHLFKHLTWPLNDVLCRCHIVPKCCCQTGLPRQPFKNGLCWNNLVSGWIWLTLIINLPPTVLVLQRQLLLKKRKEKSLHVFEKCFGKKEQESWMSRS